MRQQLHFFYEMKLEFSDQIKNHYFRNRIEPGSTLRQQITDLRYEINPYDMLGTSKDGFCNKVIYGTCLRPHDSFTIQMEGIAQTTNSAVEEQADRMESRLFSYPSAYTVPGENLHRYYQSLLATAKKKSGPCEIADYYMRQLGRIFTYQRGCSSVETVAETALAQGCGVCQDYAHILISLLRMSGIPARYVVGLISGEGESHAWVELLENGFWYGIDPTNQSWVDENYVKISSGRDYADCMISRGKFEGNALQKQSISVRVAKERENEVW